MFLEEGSFLQEITTSLSLESGTRASRGRFTDPDQLAEITISDSFKSQHPAECRLGLSETSVLSEHCRVPEH